MKLDELPVDILISLPHYLDSFEDLLSLILISTTFYKTCADTKATFPPRFAKLYGQRLFTPYPHLLIAYNAKQVANWAVKSTENRLKLTEALKGGIDGFYDLVVDVARMSLADARELHAIKYDILNPLTKRVDLEAGPAKREADYAEYGRTLDDDGGEWWTILEYPELTLLNHWIYCELFHHTVTHAYNPSVLDVEPLSVETRWDFLSYCLPDCNDKRVKVPGKIMDQAVSYAHSPWKGSRLVCFMFIHQHLYSESELSTRRIAELVGDSKGGEGDKDGGKGRNELFHRVILHQGLLAMRLVLPGGVEATKEAVEEIREKISHLREDQCVIEEDEYDEDDEIDIRHDDVWESMDSDCGRLIWNWG